jgi:hypothetical protein
MAGLMQQLNEIYARPGTQGGWTGLMNHYTPQVIEAGRRGVAGLMQSAQNPQAFDNYLKSGELQSDLGLSNMPEAIATIATGGAAMGAVKKQAAKQAAKKGLIQLPPTGHNNPPDMYGMAPGSDPRYLGAAPDRSQKTYLRYRPENLSPKISTALDAMRANKGGLKDDLIADIRLGQQVGGDDWYNTEELRDWFVKELGEEAGDAEWRQFIELIGATSTGSNVLANIGNASMYRNQGMGGAEMAKLALLAGKENIPKGFGHKMWQNHAKNVRSLHEQRWDGDIDPGVPPSKGTHGDNMKPKGFLNSLLGNASNMAADLHFTRYMAMVSKDPEWMLNDGEVAQSVISKLTEKHGKKVKKYIFQDKHGNTRIRARKSVEDGVVPIDDYADVAQVWQGMPKKNEYAAFEDYFNELGEELGMTAAQVQANLWMGAAKRTGVADSSQGTFMELIRARADKRALAEGMTREEVLKRFITQRGLLAVPAAVGAGTAAQGLMQPKTPEQY